ncbi:MAG TPA: glycosyltransferase [Mycobacteriales bacterium]|jgi:GT2 family glycosyltransferase|nr:glycosyltransferase [Mycobacteriales bacterium]
MSPRSARHAFRRHVVTAVVVAHDGAAWLPDTLAALDAQARAPQQVVAVDTGSTDESAQLCARAVGAARLLTLPRETGFGAAVAAGLSAADHGEVPLPADAVPPARDAIAWVWLLHDDSAPDPQALHELLALADEMPSATVIGPKIRTWDGRHLAEIGITSDVTGRRETGLERREVDQGQHDSVRDVLAVSSAGALIRRDVWDRLGGFDPALPMTRDDIDFGWRVNRAGGRVVVAPRAVVRHAGALAHGLRSLDADGPRRHRADRRAAFYTLLVNLPAAALLLAGPRLLIAGLARTIGFLLARRPAYAVDELAALAAVLGRPGRLRAARARRASTAKVSHRDIRHLLAGVDARLRALRDTFRGADPHAAADDHAPPRRRGAVPVESGPVSEEAENFLDGGSDWLRRVLKRPSVVLFLVLSAVALVAGRHLLPGPLFGGRLLPPPGGSHDWWDTYLTGWHAVGSGSSAAAPPYLGVLAVAATVLFGKAWLLLDVLFIGAVPLAGLSAYVCAGTVTRNRWLRVWAAATYGLLPAATGAVAAGRLDVVVVAIALPLLLRSGVRTLRRDPRFAGWRTAVGTGLGLAVVAAFSPVLWLLFALLGAFGAAIALLGASPATLAGARRRCAAGVLALVMPPVLLLPWSLTVVDHPALLIAGVGRAAPETVTDVPAHALLFADPGGPATPWRWLFLPVVVAALLALVRTGRRATAWSAWLIAACGLGLAIAMSRVSVTLPDGAGTPVWPGVGTIVCALGLLVAAMTGADGASRSLGRRDFGWRQASAGALAVVTMVVPVVAGLAWMLRGADGPLKSGVAQVVPAFVAADLDSAAQPRVLILRQRGEAVSYAVQRGDQGPTTGDADVARAGAAQRRLSRLVGRLAAGTHGDVAAGLAGYDIRYVIAVDPRGGLAARLDRVSGLVRAGGDAATLWRVVPAGARAVVLPAATARTARAGGVPSAGALQGVETVSSDGLRAGGRLIAGESDRLLVLAESANPGWRATVDGKPLRAAKAYGWAQAFEVPAAGGRLAVSWHDPARGRWLALQAALVALSILFALPTLRREDDPALPPRPRAAQQPPAPVASQARS